jgi:hypothetical protein
MGRGATATIERLAASLGGLDEAAGGLKLDTTARYTRVATGMIAGIESPLDLLSQPRKKPRKSRKEQPPALTTRGHVSPSAGGRGYGAGGRGASCRP